MSDYTFCVLSANDNVDIVVASFYSWKNSIMKLPVRC